ncbi:MAG: hypothetical protein KatS3mg039_1512 [Candidatus Kapaibacterium sp.]|nr:MAG: hypothetical protein KatS3mg039_1512 [Candidatus Kapabacteria bacterium]
MNRSLRAILLLVLYISTATELPQFAKLPLLVVHAIEHAQREQLTIGAFIAEHYFQGDVYDADRARDLQLPFKVELPGVLLLLAELLPLDMIRLNDLPPQHLRYSSFLPATPLSGIPRTIWHPPALPLR